ncbi:C2 domain-containing protein 3, partial [Eufriesea mexicana]
VLLHGLIHVTEGQELPELNTYLICRAFWREDKTRSQICNNTENPFYQFCQLVPLIYGNDLLERIKDNYIIIEVYSRNNNIDNLLGLTKLSVHQLYVAYRDPHILPYLLLTKYPVVSVDGWVPIIDPVTGRSCGQLHALVALGTAEQITLLKISRNLQTNGIMSCTMHLDKFSDYGKHSQNMQFHNTCELQLNKELISQDNSQIHDTNEVERQLFFSNSKTRECQTDISTVNEFKCNEILQEKTSNLEHFILHNTVSHLTQGLNVNKINIDQETQTEINVTEEEQTNIEEQICANELNFNNSSNDSDNSSVKHNFYLPTETYRSVGVGAEYNEEIDQQPNSGHSNTTFELSTIIHGENELTNPTCKQTMFRAHVEIECALHLPKIEKINETINPSTYVSFQTNKCDYTKYSNSYMITNVFPHSCNPKWNWKCDTELPTELLLHDEKRLILKIWRLLDTDISMQINLEKDVVIGFSAIDLSILISGFATVSGWFHVMDFTGKCNGQIKVSITPLDNLSLFGKSITSLNTVRVPKCSMPWVPLHINETHSCVIQEEEKSVHSENYLNDPITQIGFEDISMSFLSLSLKQKLTELDEITKRLKSRLHDITNTAFEDDLENEFELNNDNENNECKIITPIVSVAAIDCNNRIYHSTNTKENDNQNISNERKNFLSQTYVAYNKALNCEIINPNSSKILDSYNKQDLSNNNIEIQQQNHAIQNIKTLENTFTDYPEQGTKAHISYLLDKLSLQFPAQHYLNKGMPMKENMTNLLTNSLSNSNLQDINKCNQELKMSTLSTQMNNIYEQSIKMSENPAIGYITETKEIDACDRNLSDVSQIANKVSTVIREELIAEESSNTSKCDELTTYLVTSNIRHMDVNNMCNPLLYQHLVPDLHYSHTLSEEETIKQLDNRYNKVFSTSISNRLNKIHSLVETNVCSENTEHFQRMTPSGLSENIDDNIDVTVLHNTNYNDLVTSTESTTTISIENSLVKSIESEAVGNGDPISTETSILVLSRQAPDGGNPIEDNRKSLVKHQEDKILNS